MSLTLPKEKGNESFQKMKVWQREFVREICGCGECRQCRGRRKMCQRLVWPGDAGENRITSDRIGLKPGREHRALGAISLSL